MKPKLGYSGVGFIHKLSYLLIKGTFMFFPVVRVYRPRNRHCPSEQREGENKAEMHHQ